jgi:hypothetical protein
VPGAHLQRARQAVSPGAEQEAEWAAALGQADVLEWSEFVDGCDDERAAREPEGAGNPIRPFSRRGLVLVNEPSEYVSAPNTVEGDVGL